MRSLATFTCRALALGLAFASICVDGLRAQQPPYLVTDANPRLLSPPSYPEGMTRAGGLVYFAASTSLYGRELYATLGAPEIAGSTALVLDIRPGLASASPEDFCAFGNLLFFTADDGVHGRELWRSDGTAIGTFLVRDLRAGASSEPAELTVHNGFLYFTADDGSHGRELFRTDGTRGGTLLVRDIALGPAAAAPASLRSAGALLYFAAEDAASGRELWCSDGSANGTRLVRDLVPGGSSYPTTKASVGGRVLFVATDGASGYELWSSDGSAAGTVLLRDLEPGAGDSFTQSFAVSGNEVLFFARYRELWRSDGTSQGTQLVSANLGNGLHAASLGDQAIFAVISAQNRAELWRSDGTLAGTFLLRASWPNYGLTELRAFGSQVWFQGNHLATANEGSLWRTDGTIAGTVEIARIHRDWPYRGGGPYDLAEAANGRVVFSANDGVHEREPWVSDGTLAGTALLADLEIDFARSHPSRPSELVDVLGVVFYACDDGVHGRELWRSDGSVQGTHLVADLRAGEASSDPQGLVRVGERLFFSADDGVSGRELWVSDGTSGGTQRVADLLPGPNGSSPSDLVAHRGALYFGANDGLASGLWRSDGTPLGTQRLSSFAVSELRSIGEKLYFACDDRTHGEELWCSDGTPAGTQLLVDVDPTINARGPQSSSPRGFVAWNGLVYFTAAHTSFGNGNLWRTDGTAVGTTRVASFASTAPNLALPHTLTPAGAQLFFIVSELPFGLSRLFVSDGTTAGTRLVTSRLYVVNTLVPLGARVLLAARDPLQSELWTSDGTDLGTTRVVDLNGAASSNPAYFVALGTRRVLFAAQDGASGIEPWITDGTTSGTRRIGDIANATSGASSLPHGFTLSRGNVLFAADDGYLGDELWAYFPGATARSFGDGCGGAANAWPALSADDPVLGGTSTFRGEHAPAASALLLYVSGPAAAPFASLSGCPLQLDLATAFLAFAFAPASASWSLALPVPHGPQLVGARVLVQALHLSPSAELAATNAVELTLGR